MLVYQIPSILALKNWLVKNFIFPSRDWCTYNDKLDRKVVFFRPPNNLHRDTVWVYWLQFQLNSERINPAIPTWWYILNSLRLLWPGRANLKLYPLKKFRQNFHPVWAKMMAKLYRCGISINNMFQIFFSIVATIFITIASFATLTAAFLSL